LVRSIPKTLLPWTITATAVHGLSMGQKENCGWVSSVAKLKVKEEGWTQTQTRRMLIIVSTQALEIFNLNQSRFLAVVAVLGSDHSRRFKSGVFQSATAVHSSNVAKLKVKE
jgi:hypothetical protein